MFPEQDSQRLDRPERLPDPVPPEMDKPNTDKPSYYEAWHVPARTASPELHSPNYHSAAQGFETGRIPPTEAVRQKTRTARKGRGMQIFRVLCLLLACGVVSALCSALVIESRLKNETQMLPEEKTVGTLVEKPQSAGVTENAAALPSVGSSMTATEIYELACRQSVGIQVTSTGFNIWGQAVIGSPISGSGFIVSENGYVVTNYHVIENAAKNGRSDITVQFYDESSYPAALVGYDSEADLAVLKIDAEGLSAVTVGSMDACRVGSRVYAIGNPLGELTFTMTDGMICALDRVITTGTSASINVFQINAAVNSGNSGGPVYNERGEVIGIVDAKYAAAGVEGIGFAIPLDDAVDMINDLVTTGHVTGRSYLGVSVRTITASVAAYYNLPQGAYVDYVEGGSCAEKCGLISGDIITQIGSYDIKSSEDVRLAKSSYRAGDTVTLEWYRNGETHTAELVFDEEQ